MFKFVLNNFMSEICRLYNGINISMKIQSFYIFYILKICKKRYNVKYVTDKKNHKIHVRNDKEGYFELPKETKGNEEKKKKNYNIIKTCKKYIILTDTVSNLFSVSKCNMKKKKSKKNSFFFDNNICILSKRKFDLYIDDYHMNYKNMKPQIHLDIHINKWTNEKIIKISLSNFYFFYSSTLFILFSNVVINYILTYIQEKQKLNILLFQYDNFRSAISSKYTNPHLENKGYTYEKNKSYTSIDKYTLHFLSRNKLKKIKLYNDKFVSIEQIDNICDSSEHSILDDNNDEEIDMRNKGIAQNSNNNENNICKKEKTKEIKDINGDYTGVSDNTFYYDMYENEKYREKKKKK